MRDDDFLLAITMSQVIRTVMKYLGPHQLLDAARELRELEPHHPEDRAMFDTLARTLEDEAVRRWS
jgi:hypothetical protein